MISTRDYVESLIKEYYYLKKEEHDIILQKEVILNQMVNVKGIQYDREPTHSGTDRGNMLVRLGEDLKEKEIALKAKHIEVTALNMRLHLDELSREENKILEYIYHQKLTLSEISCLMYYAGHTTVLKKRNKILDKIGERMKGEA